MEHLFIKKATDEEIADASIVKVTNIVAKAGVVVAKGLDDGEYNLVEEKLRQDIL